MHETKIYYKWKFDKRVKITRNNVRVYYLVFIKKDYNPTNDPNYKLARIEAGTYKVTEVDEKKCEIVRDEKITEKISLDRVVIAPKTDLLKEIEEIER